MKTLGQLPMIVQADCGPIRDAVGHFRFTGSESRPGADMFARVLVASCCLQMVWWLRHNNNLNW